MPPFLRPVVAHSRGGIRINRSADQPRSPVAPKPAIHPLCVPDGLFTSSFASLQEDDKVEDLD
jgi:hypothetical protein